LFVIPDPDPGSGLYFIKLDTGPGSSPGQALFRRNDERGNRKMTKEESEREAGKREETIHLDGLSPDFKRELSRMPEAENLMACFTCLTCAASCPVAQVESRFNPIRIIRMALLGMRREVLSCNELWLCSSCYTCQERCPNDVRITDFLTLLKNMAHKEGHSPQGIRAQEDLVLTNGRIYPLDDFDNKKRQKIDLPLLPTSCGVLEALFRPD
jgi:heterodisulfide reductase subunit C2